MKIEFSQPTLFFPSLIVLGLIATGGCASQIENPPPDRHAEVRFDQVTWLCTHNAYNASESGFKYTNQTRGIRRQLEDGVRALMLDVWESDNDIVLRHGDQLGGMLGQQPFSLALNTIREFLEQNPDVIVTLILESYVAANRVAGCFEEAGLNDYCYSHRRFESWPTLNSMRSTNERLVVFSDRAQDCPGWYMPVWDHCFENHWESQSAEDLLEHQPGRGDPANSLFIVNNFLSNPLKSPSVALEVNNRDFLEKRFGESSSSPGRPNFIVVDFYEQGDCLQFVDSMNVNK